MADITLKGNTIHTKGNIPAVGTQAPDFTLVKNDLSKTSLSDFKGHRLVLNIFPSIDTGTCAASVRQFNMQAAGLDGVYVLNISRDLPFAQGRFCGAEGIDRAISLSDFATGQFGQDYELEIVDGPLAGLHSRVVLVLDEKGKILYTEQVSELVDEPNYEAALAVLK